MIYSSSKSSFLGLLKELNVPVEQRIEISDFEDLSEKDIHTTFHPIKEVEEKITKPKPKGRGTQTKGRGNFKDFFK